jgi:hypothetical protein
VRPTRGADKTDARFATFIDEDGNPPCQPADDCAVCRLFTVQRPGETPAAWLSRITGGFVIRSECIHGHPFTPENTHTSPIGSWICKACRRDATARYRRRKAIA